MEDKLIRNLFIGRAVMWALSLAATIYWIVWSFKIYVDYGEDVDVQTYASIFRPRFYVALILTVIFICISFGLRKISDNRKNELKKISRE